MTGESHGLERMVKAKHDGSAFDLSSLIHVPRR